MRQARDAEKSKHLFGSSQLRKTQFGNGQTKVHCLQLDRLPQESYLCQGSVTADRLPDGFAIQAVSEVVDAFVAIDRLTIDKSVEGPDAAVGCGYGSSVEPTAFRRSDA